MNTELHVGNPRQRPRRRRQRTARQRDRSHVVRVIILDPDDPRTAERLRRPRRTNPHGWRFANEARFQRGRQKTEAMARRWERAEVLFPRYRAAVVALVSGTTRAAVRSVYRIDRYWVNSIGRCNSSTRRSCNGCFETTSV